MTLSNSYDAFLALVRLGVGHPVYKLPENFDWQAIRALALKHGLEAVVLDGIEKLPESKRPPKDIVLQWIGEVLQNYEQRYEFYCKSIAEMAEFYNTHHHKMMVLKGYACSLDWPKPNHRPCGDIDIWLFGQQKHADSLLQEQKGIKVDGSHHHHTVFYWNDLMVENHYDFLNVHHHKSNEALEAILKELGRDDSHYVHLNGEWVYIPSPKLHALFLLRHMMSNFASTGMLLRQLLDWAFFVEKHGKEVDWNWLLKILEKFGMMPLFQLFNAICVENLGFPSDVFPTSQQYVSSLKDRVLNEILSPEFTEKEKGSIIRRSLFKYRRWKANEWKHKLCYKESMWSAFWSGVWSHLLKPASI